ncbi:hypothetical protein RUM43_005774 [Polyplax serrata]|uniref:Uncharacterized protein n=1 Tax=Polyplax serrata TaxID=468196 RepID=A0AAN8PXJ8_POLSC
MIQLTVRGIGTVAKRLVDLAKENNSTDNITVIVFFLTDPSEINNRSIDVTGHRPKIILQNGVIMDPNYQTNEPGLNGIYETNGNHFDDPLRNESDEDLGPETDVDAVDDVLTSPKTMNPFGNDCWQKVQTNMENANMDKLIEFRREETIKMEIGDGKDFSEGLAGELKNVGSNAKDLAGMIFANNTMDGKLVEDMFMKDMVNMTCQKTSEGFGDTEDSDLRNEMRLSEDKNSFEGSVINNYSGILNVKNNGSEDNKYGADVKMESDELRDLVNSNYKENQFELSTGGVQEAENAKDGIFGENARPIENEEHETFTGNPFGGPRYNEDLTETIGDTSETKIEEEAPEKKVDLGGDNKEVAFTASHDHLLDHEVPLVEKTNTNAVGTGFEFGATHEPTPTLTIKEPSDLFMEHQPVDLNHTLEHSSIIETVDILKPSSDMSSEVDVQPDKSEESMPELLQPTAPALEGELTF